MGNLKIIAYVAIALFVGYNVFFSGDDSTASSDGPLQEGDKITTGLITTVKEVEKDQFKIEDEQTVPTPEESLIIAKYLDNTVDTFTLDEARLVESGQGSSIARSVVRAAGFGFLGYMMGRSMGSHRPNPNAYMDNKTYQRVNNNAGRTMQSSAKRSGFGSGKSSRSYGG